MKKLLVMSIFTWMVTVSALFGWTKVQAGISTGWIPPTCKQGVADYKPALTARYARLAELGLGTKIYNVWWSEMEPSGVSSRTAPFSCPDGFFLVPAAEAERIAKGYKRYRCINQNKVNKLDDYFSRDTVAGMQTAVVLWSSPPQYRYQGCLGFEWNGSFLYDGCVPRDDAMDDWEDYVNFLADRYSNGSGKKIYHFIIWNEVASGMWFDYSPMVPTHASSLNDDQRSAWVSKYVQMLQRAHSALARRTSGVLMHISIDPQWQTPKFNTIQHLGSKTVLDKIWIMLDTSIDWSIAVHPYNDPITADSGWINFQNLSIVADYQLQKLKSRGVANPFGQPQLRLFASEQGWTQKEGIDVQARNICEAHAFSIRYPAMFAQTHNWLQDNTDGDTSYGLLRTTAGEDLSAANGMATWEAYRSTGVVTWGKRDDHYCCQQHGLGCAGFRVHPMNTTAASNDILWSPNALVDRNYDSCYSSQVFSSSSNTRGTYVAAWLPGRNAGGWMVSTVRLHARMVNGIPVGFPRRYDIWLTKPDNSDWLYIGAFARAPDANGVATIPLPRTYRTWGVMIRPSELGTDDNGNYFFQLSELELIPTREYPQTYASSRAESNNVLTGWPVSSLIDRNYDTPYSSTGFSSSTNTNNTYVATWLTNQSTVSSIRIWPRVYYDIPTAFPEQYAVYLTAPDNSQWVYMGNFYAQPDITGVASRERAYGAAVVTLPYGYKTFGVLLKPIILGKDPNGNYFFQLSEIELQP